MPAAFSGRLESRLKGGKKRRATVPKAKLDIQAAYTIPIDPDGRYVVILKMSQRGFEETGEFEALAKSIKDWWDGDDKFLFIGTTEDRDIRLERVDPDAG
jgi:hypothetical protein